MKKISFLGDIMCEPPYLEAAIKRGHDFYTTFSNIKNLLNESDFVIGNLETPIAGEKLGYTSSLYSFNTPASFLDALKKIKIDLFLTANNHCLDRGVEGLINTLDELDKRSMKHTGTFRDVEEQNDIFTCELDGSICSFISFNAYINGDKWLTYKKDLSSYNINQLIDMDLFTEYREKYRANSIPFYKLRKKLSTLFPSQLYALIKKKMKYKFKPYVDNEPLEEIEGIYFEKAVETIKKALIISDFVFAMPHCGGQFNTAPGTRSKEIFQKLLEAGASIVIGYHPHAIQAITLCHDKPCVFSLGNASASPSTPYLVKSSLPQYGLIYHVYIDNKKINKTAFSIIKMIEEPDQYLMVYPVDELIKICDNVQQQSIIDDLSLLYKRVTGSDTFPGVMREYPLSF